MLARHLLALALAAWTPLAAGKPTLAEPPGTSSATAEWWLCDLIGCAVETTVTVTKWRTATTTASTTCTASQTCELGSASPITSSNSIATTMSGKDTRTTSGISATSALTSSSISSEVTVSTATTYSPSLSLTSTSITTGAPTSDLTSSSVAGSVPSSSKIWTSITNSTSKPSTTTVSSRWFNTTRTSDVTTTTTITTPTWNITPSSASSSILTSPAPGSRIVNGTTRITPSTMATPTASFTSTPITSTSTSTSTTGTRTPVPPSKLQPFECLTDAYLIQFKTLLQVNLRTGARRVLATGVGVGGGGGDGSSSHAASSSVGDINSVGYNPLDNYLYGTQGQTLLRIGRDGRTEPVLALPSPANLGDVDLAGQYFFSDSGASWGQVDLAPGSRRYGQLVAAGNATHGGLRRLADWAFTPAHPEYAYSVGVDNKHAPVLARWSTQTHEWETLRRYGDGNFRATLFGAVMATSDGVVYASDNASGQLFRFPLKDLASASKAGVGPRASSNDGARCALAPDAAE
ncbi:hypothetical protein JDV02_001377 [Purpureocillium takamizusanense]|uniref:DUF6923 domain-containing protein n=1 Tax=Purpureocillium takamizusanense TaxID=2060973 RepID=A0A9Q8V7S5_9HYPO|nr:uncharacterized protein JDV02_001377 [Purpureocillium takamizusanense]UNI14781.1 hypothetical protein JDV02_001377 [Purpureocillium takamizusanense]